ncbi:type II toxin-antitoxin system RelE/ParE family toxin [candidate division KSB1 bacterium]|nr:type II toxin-antitoxin system RelE/ParE family toxin [candidate division KSB1 bacterium]
MTLKRTAQKELGTLPDPIMQRIYGQIKTLADEPWPRQSKKLQAGQGHRLRVGDYRVLYEVDRPTQVVTV